jgi:hypothetical protein
MYFARAPPGDGAAPRPRATGPPAGGRPAVLGHVRGRPAMGMAAGRTRTLFLYPSLGHTSQRFRRTRLDKYLSFELEFEWF